MTESRLVTLTGPGGVGKTRLAVELASRSKKSYKDGVWLIELDSLRSGDRVASAVATTLQVPDQSNRAASERVVDYLREREILLILDNCEHVLQDTAELVDTLLSQAPKVQILATSREPLHLVPEHVCEVPPLSTPPLAQGGNGGSIEHFEAVALLVDRVRHVVPDFSVTPDNRYAIAQLCAQLDGIPFALELAAVKLRALSPQQLLDRLGHRFQLLNRGDRTRLPRQQTLQALIDWSYELCSGPEQLLWRRISVFPDVFDLDAIEDVCGFGELHPAEVLDLLEQLVAKSIVQTDRTAEQVRYRQLMTMREYGAQLLAEAGEDHELSRRHRDHYLGRAEHRLGTWGGPDQAAIIAITRVERPNLTSALEWSLITAGEHDAAAQIAVVLRYHWIAGGFLSDGRAWLERILRHRELSPQSRNQASWVASWVALLQGDHDEAASHFQAVLHSPSDLQDPEVTTFAQHCQALHHLFTGNLNAAIELFLKVSVIHEQHGRAIDQLTAMFQLVTAQFFAGRAEDGLEVGAAALAIAERDGERWNRAYLHWACGMCHWKLGDFSAANRAARRALKIQQDFEDGICTALSIELLSWISVSTSDFARSRELSDAARDVWRGLGTDISAFGPHITEMSNASAAKARKSLGAARPQEGAGQRRLSTAGAIAVALGGKSRKKTATGPEGSNLLTRREMEVAELVSQGLTSRQIAGKLVLSPRTVEGHVERIFTKLDFTSRGQISSWVESLGHEA